MKTIGVDLGTTNSCVYYLDHEDNPVLVTDHLGRKIFPSAVWSDGLEREALVGHPAKSRLGQQPPPVVAVKRKIGTTETVSLGGRQVSAVTVSAHILSFLKSLVEETTGDEVGAAVVTVPAYFDAPAKKDTYAAAVEAFFGGNPARAKGRLELQLEPEAAAFAYTLEDPAESLRILAYDLGGGTFDVTVLEKSPAGGLAAIKFGGDPHLGGDNVDDRLAAWFLYLLQGGRPEALERILDPRRYPVEVQYTVLQQVLTNDSAALRGELRPEDRELLAGAKKGYALALDGANPEDVSRIQVLKMLAERAKMDLTVASEAVVTRQGAFPDQAGNLVDIDLTLDRGTFNRLIGDFVGRTLEETSRVLAASGLQPESVDRLILVGGSSRMPIVREELEKRFPCPVLMADPDLIVARGAVLKARQLRPPVVAGTGAATVELDYPRKTADEVTQVRGIVARPLAGYRAFLSRDGEEVAEAAVEGERFLLESVPLLRNAANRFELEIAGAEGELYATVELTIVHDEQAGAAEGPLVVKVTKPIFAEGIRGEYELLREGESLPANVSTTCRRGTDEDRIVIPFYEGDRWLTNLVITGVDPQLRLGAEIDLQLVVDKDYTCSATATVRETRQSATVEFQISRVEIPTLEELDRQLAEALEEFENDIQAVRDRDHRAALSRRARRIEADYGKAKRALAPDMHHLYSQVAELRKLLIEVRSAHDSLTPPREDFEELLGTTRRLAGRLDGGRLSSAQALDKVASLERSGCDAWDREDRGLWGDVNAQLAKLRDDVERALAGPAPDARQFPPERIQGELLGWLAALREQACDAGLATEFEGELAEVERAIRQVDLRKRDQARNELLALVSRLRPLDFRIARAIREQGGKTAADGSTGANVIF